jgi:hypothetical protein
MARMDEEPLDGGHDAGAVRIGDTVHRRAGPWTPAVHALLTYLADHGFTRAPRPLGFDEQGREILTFLEGESIGRRKPRPAWVHADDTLIQVARWLRDCHQVLANFVPPPDAIWRDGFPWSDGQIVVHNDATIHNAAWSNGQLTGFFDWDFARPATPEWDVAFAAYTWVPLHARSEVAGARYLAGMGAPGRIVNLVARHSNAMLEAEMRGLADVLSEFPDESGELRDALWFCDLTTSPDGVPVSARDRISEIQERYGSGHESLSSSPSGARATSRR